MVAQHLTGGAQFAFEAWRSRNSRA